MLYLVTLTGRKYTGGDAPSLALYRSYVLDTRNRRLSMSSALPSGTVTFLFTDIEGSTRLLQRLGDTYATVLGDHQRLLRQAFAAHDGIEVDTQGDSFFVAFPTAPAAVAVAAAAARALAAYPWPEGAPVRVRIGLHTGAPQLVGNRYVGLDVHRAARIAAAGHGGQILLSAATKELASQHLPDGATLRELGAFRLKDLQHSEQISQLVLAGLPADFPPLKTLDRQTHNLPIQPTLLLGREEPLAALVGLLGRDDVRLVTVTGAGGIGKIRLALQVAAEVLENFPDGVWFVRLSRLTDPALAHPGCYTEPAAGYSPLNAAPVSPGAAAGSPGSDQRIPAPGISIVSTVSGIPDVALTTGGGELSDCHPVLWGSSW
jgi:class 3 adenylate cyclase